MRLCCVLHFVRAGNVVWFLKPFSTFQSTQHTHGIDAMVRNSSTCKHFPTCHSKSPLLKRNTIPHRYSDTMFSPHHISLLIIYVILNALWSHPPNWNSSLSSFLTLLLTIVVSIIHILCQSKVSHFDNTLPVNPEL